MGQCSSSEVTSMVSTEEEFEYTEECVVPKDITIVVRFHPSVVEVEFCAFNDCHKLKKVILNEGLQTIGANAFWFCTSLSSITLPSTITEIEGTAFYSCYNLRDVVFNEWLQKIGESAFRFCTSLITITIPSSVNEIELGVFARCNNLREVVFHGVPRKIGKDAFWCCRSLERFTFPTISSRLDALIQTGHWDEVENKVNEVRGVVELSGGELFVSAQTMGGGNNWDTVRRDIEKIVRLVSYYEPQLPILDIAFIDACDIGVPGPVKDKVLQYLI